MASDTTAFSIAGKTVAAFAKGIRATAEQRMRNDRKIRITISIEQGMRFTSNDNLHKQAFNTCEFIVS
jgi:hypothetical protein